MATPEAAAFAARSAVSLLRKFPKASHKTKSGKSHKSPVFPRAVTYDERQNLYRCIDAVNLSRSDVKTTSEGELKVPTKGPADPKVVAAMRSFFPSGKIYDFRLAQQVVPYGTDGAGNMLVTVAFSPAVGTFPEWASLAALFDEVNLVRARWTVIGGASALKNIGLVVGYNPNNISSTPASTNAVLNLANAKMYSSYATASRLFVMQVKIPPGRAWAETTVPAVASPPAGCVGTIDMANAGAAGTATSTYVYGFCEIQVMFRNRI